VVEKRPVSRAREGLCSLFLLLAVPGAPAPAGETTYYGHVEPILRRSCSGCHGGARPKGGLDLQSLEGLRTGGKKGAPIVPGKPGESLLFLLASREKKPAMPPDEEDALAPGDVAHLRAWIEGGATPGERPAETAPHGRPLVPPVYPRPPVITALAWSADGRLLLVAGHGEVLVHDAASVAGEGQDGVEVEPRARLVGEAERLNALAVSPSGELLAAAGGSPGLFGELQVWSAGTWKLERFVRIGKDTLFAAAFSPDGGRIAVACADGTVRLIDPSTGAEVLALEVHADWVTGVAFAGDGTRLVSAGRDRTIRSFEPGGTVIHTIATWDEPVLTLAARRGSPVVLAAGEGRRPVLLDAIQGKEVLKLEEPPGPILASAFSPDGALLAVGGAGDEVRIHAADGGARKAALRGARDWIYALAFSPDGGRLAAAGHEGIVRVYDVKEGKQVRGFVPVTLERSTQ
jgi:hypothetical protein